jgi:hypothetical protein
VKGNAVSVDQENQPEAELPLFGEANPEAVVSVDSPEPVDVTEPLTKAGVIEHPTEEPSTKVQADEPRDEIDRLDPQPVQMVLASGTEFDLEPLKLRQFLRLLRIVTRGAADVLDSAQLDFEDPQSFVQTFLGMVLFSVPEAEEETVDFLKSMVKPRGMTGNPDKDLLLVRQLSSELDNPELEDTITIIQCVVQRESEDLRALGKRLGTMFQTAQKMGATKNNAPNPQV